MRMLFVVVAVGGILYRCVIKRKVPAKRTQSAYFFGFDDAGEATRDKSLPVDL